MNSLEMQGERLGDRWLCAQAASLDAGHLKSGQLSADEQQQALEAARQLSCLPVYVDDNPKASMDHIRSSALLQKSKGHCDLLIIDYLQLCDMKSEQKNRNREQEVAEASRKAKLIAKELDIPVILLCQLNRECEMRADKRPALSDLRESGAIEPGCRCGDVALSSRTVRTDVRAQEQIPFRRVGHGDSCQAPQR